MKNNIIDLLSNLKTKGISISLDTDQKNLKVRGNIHQLSEKDRWLIKDTKEEIVAFLKNHLTTVYPIALEEIGNELELSPNQKSIWIHEQISGNKMLYIIPALFEFHSSYFEEKKFLQAIDITVAHHEILRTVFTERFGEPRQQILSSINIHQHVHTIDLRESLNAEEEMQRLANDHYKIPFHLFSQPLWELILFLLPQNKVCLFLKMHHLIADGESIKLLTAYLFNQYQEPVNTTSTTPPALQYKHYTKWINNKKLFKASATFWKNQFEHYLETFSLPGIHQSESKNIFEGREHRFSFPKKLNNDILSTLEKNRLNLSTLFTAAFGIVLSKASACSDFVVGIPAASRNHPMLQTMIGNCVNTLPFRIQIDYDQIKSIFLAAIQNKFYDILEHQHYSFEHILEEISYTRTTNQSPLFNVMLSFPDVPTSTLPERKINFNRNISLYDLTFTILNKNNHIEIIAEHNTAALDETAIRNFIQYMEQVIKQLIDEEDKKIATIKLLSTEEEEQMKNHFCKRDKVTAVSSLSVIDLIKKQAVLTPNHTAVISDQQTITYHDLINEAIFFGNYLKAQKLHQGDRVTVQLPTSSDHIISMLGIWLAGGVYVPIDTTFPIERVTHILKDCKPKIQVDGQLFTHYSQLKVQNIDPDSFFQQLNFDDQAYILYTSGSTGKPKGVLVSHGSLVNKIVEEIELLNANDTTTCAVLTPTVFDVSFLETVLPLCCGGKMMIPTVSNHMQLQTLIDELIKEEVSIIQGTPTWFANFVSDILPEQAVRLNQTLQFICIGGESLNKVLVKKIKTLLPDVKINNHYGPTEATIDAIVNENLSTFDVNIIGKPMGNTYVYVLDNQGNILPSGIQGELCIGGPSIARGYWKDKIRTAEKFKETPFLPTPLYFTGDLARWTHDAQLEFLGRKDEQVKLRGYRIELQEINLALLNCYGVEDAHTRIIGNSLVSWIVKKDSFLEDIQHKLEKTLPHYMIPSSIERVDFLPRNANGKIDFVQLQQQRNAHTTHDCLPKNEIEQQLILIWEEILQKKGISTKENFFELGGDSLSMQKCLFHIRNTFQRNLSFRDLYTAANIEDIAKLLHSSEQQKEETIHIQKSQIDYEMTTHLLSYLLVLGIEVTEDENNISIKGNTINLPLQVHTLIEHNKETISHHIKSFKQGKVLLWPASYLQNNVWKFLEIKGKHSNMRFGYCLNTPLDSEQLQNAFYKVIERHEILRTKFFLQEDILFQKVQLLNYEKFKIKRTFANTLNEVHEICTQTASHIFNYFDEEPLITCTSVINRENGSQVIFFVVNHLIFDGISIDVFVNDLLSFYTNTGNPISLRFQFKEYVAYQNFLEHTHAFQAAKEYWKEIFFKPYKALPFKNEITSNPTSATPNVLNTVLKTISLTGIQLEQLKIYCHKNQSTISSFFQALYLELIKQLNDANDILISANISNRENGLIDDQVGLFTNSIFLRYEQLASLNFSELLKKVRDTLITSLEHNQYYPSNRVFNELNLNERYGHEKLRKFVYNHVQASTTVSLADGIHAADFNIPTDKIGCYYLLMYINEMNDQIQIILEGNSAKFNVESINEMIDLMTSIFSTITNEQPMLV